MNKVTTTKLLAIIAVIFVTAALVTLPYQNQEANAAPPTKKYRFSVTLSDVPANADDLIVNATVLRMPFFVAVSDMAEETVSSPSEGDVVRFADIRVPSGSDENAFLICATQATSPDINNTCDDFPLPSSGGGGGPIRVAVTYPYPQ